MARVVELDGSEDGGAAAAGQGQTAESVQQQRLRLLERLQEQRRRLSGTDEQLRIQLAEAVRQQRVHQAEAEAVRQQRVQQAEAVRQQRPQPQGTHRQQRVQQHAAGRQPNVRLSVTVQEQRVQLSLTDVETSANEAHQQRTQSLQRLLFVPFVVLMIIAFGFLLYTNLSSEDPTLNEIPIIVNRTSWQAKPPKSVKRIDPPVLKVVISHTGTRECKTSSECQLVLHKLQDFHRDRGFYDIAYNFLVGGDGVVYEGRGWGVEYSPTHVAREHSLGISFIGSFSEVRPPPTQMQSARQLIRLGVREGHISQNYKLIPDWDPDVATNPGQELFNGIKYWPHWSTS